MEEAHGHEHRAAFRVEETGADARGRLTPAGLCRLLQSAAGRDAQERGAGMPELLRDGLAWVLLRLRVEAAAWPTLGQEVWVTTWPTSFGGAVAERAFVVEGPYAMTFARAASRWAVTDLHTRRATRLPPAIRALPVPTRLSPIALGPAPESPGPGPPIVDRGFEVGEADLDVVGHATNSRYVDWAFAALEEGWAEARRLACFDVTFRREARRGDVVRSRLVARDDARLRHQLAHEADEGLLAVVESLWTPCAPGGGAGPG